MKLDISMFRWILDITILNEIEHNYVKMRLPIIMLLYKDPSIMFSMYIMLISLTMGHVSAHYSEYKRTGYFSSAPLLGLTGPLMGEAVEVATQRACKLHCLNTKGYIFFLHIVTCLHKFLCKAVLIIFGVSRKSPLTPEIPR